MAMTTGVCRRATLAFCKFYARKQRNTFRKTKMLQNLINIKKFGAYKSKILPTTKKRMN